MVMGGVDIVAGRVESYLEEVWGAQVGRENYCTRQHLKPPVPWLLYGSSARPTGPHTDGT